MIIFYSLFTKSSQINKVSKLLKVQFLVTVTLLMLVLFYSTINEIK